MATIEYLGIHRYAFVAPRGIPFLPMYTWVGLWTSLFLTIAACTGAANLIRYCTRFTEDVFNAFLGTSYLHSAATAMWSRLANAAAAAALGASHAASTSASALLSLVYGVLTFTCVTCLPTTPSHLLTSLPSPLSPVSAPPRPTLLFRLASRYDAHFVRLRLRAPIPFAARVRPRRASPPRVTSPRACALSSLTLGLLSRSAPSRSSPCPSSPPSSPR
jgi:hypothetical protein